MGNHILTNLSIVSRDLYISSDLDYSSLSINMYIYVDNEMITDSLTVLYIVNNGNNIVFEILLRNDSY